MATVYPSSDTYMADPPDHLVNYSTEPIMVLGVPTSNVQRRTLLAFDLSALSLSILSGTLRLYIATPATAALNADVYRVTPAGSTYWTDGTVTWDWRDGIGLPWTKPGGDFDATSAIEFQYPLSDGWLEIDVTTLCQDAQDYRAGQLWIILTQRTITEFGSIEIGSTESAPEYYPHLVIVEGREGPFEPVEGDVYTSGAAEADVYTRGAAEGEAS